MKTGLRAVLGSTIYEICRPWGVLPESVEMRYVSSLAVDSTDFVYLLQRVDPPVVVFDPDGQYAGSWGSGLISDGHGIFITEDDRVLLVDRDAHCVIVCDLDGSPQVELGYRHRPRNQQPFNHPTDAATAPNGDIYVADGYANSCVHCFSPAGEHKGTWGMPGSEPSQFTTPHGLWITGREEILVGDRENLRVQRFTLDGTYLGEWGGFLGVMDIWGDPRGNLFVTDGATSFSSPRITLLSHKGEMLGRCRSGDLAHGIWGDSCGNLYIAEPFQNRITQLVPAAG